MAASNVTITAKFREGTKVWVFRNEDGKFYEGTIKDIQSWDKWSGFRYEVRHDGETEIIINVEEKYIFLTKEEIINDRFISESGDVQVPAQNAE